MRWDSEPMAQQGRKREANVKVQHTHFSGGNTFTNAQYWPVTYWERMYIHTNHSGTIMTILLLFN